MSPKQSMGLTRIHHIHCKNCPDTFHTAINMGTTITVAADSHDSDSDADDSDYVNLRQTQHPAKCQHRLPPQPLHSAIIMHDMGCPIWVVLSRVMRATSNRISVC